jgi:hypothetical protein
VEVGENREDAAVGAALGGQAELVEDAGHVGFDGAGREEQSFGDRVVGVALGDQFEDVALGMTPVCTVAATRIPSRAPATLTPGAPLADRNDT